MKIKKKLLLNRSLVKKLLQILTTRKTTGIDTIPPKLIKLAADSFCPILTQLINTSTEQGIFPTNAKTASVVPLDKGKPNKNEISNLDP